MIPALALLVTLVYWPSPAVYYQQWRTSRTSPSRTVAGAGGVCCAGAAVAARNCRRAGAVPALAVLALGGCILAWLVCYRASIQDVHITIFPAIFWLAVTAAFGLRVGLLLAFPVAFFYFAVPSWSQLGNPLQSSRCLPCAGFSGSRVQRC